jgi:hypothetical protein
MLEKLDYMYIPRPRALDKSFWFADTQEKPIGLTRDNDSFTTSLSRIETKTPQYPRTLSKEDFEHDERGTKSR